MLSNQPQGGFITRKPTPPSDLIASNNDDSFGSFFSRGWGSQNNGWGSQNGYQSGYGPQNGYQQQRWDPQNGYQRQDPQAGNPRGRVQDNRQGNRLDNRQVQQQQPRWWPDTMRRD